MDGRVYLSLHEDGLLNGRVVDTHALLGWRHALYDASRFVGLRNRLRCPCCKSVGTWKPHGGRFDLSNGRFENGSAVKRWLCKWCGLYVGPEGVREARLGAHAWSLDDDDDETPYSVCVREYKRPINPWVG